jgi:hypothetical protein
MNPMSAEDPSNVPSAAHEPPAIEPSTPLAIVAREPRQDPLTGLPLLRYRFTGSPTLRPGDPAPDGAWRVLRVESREGDTVLDLEMHAGATSAADHPASIDDDAAETAFATLAHAADLGLAHGDLGAHRLWRRGQRTWIEGYGVPWRAGATPAEDARAMADALLSTPGTRLSASLRARLEAVRDGGGLSLSHGEAMGASMVPTGSVTTDERSTEPGPPAAAPTPPAPRDAEPGAHVPIEAATPALATDADLPAAPAVDAVPYPVAPAAAIEVAPDVTSIVATPAAARSAAEAAEPKRTKSTRTKAKRSKSATKSRPRSEAADASAVPVVPPAPAPADAATTDPNAAGPKATMPPPAGTAPVEAALEPAEAAPAKAAPAPVEPAPEPVEAAPEPVEAAPEPVEPAPEPVEAAPEPTAPAPPTDVPTPQPATGPTTPEPAAKPTVEPPAEPPAKPPAEPPAKPPAEPTADPTEPRPISAPAATEAVPAEGPRTAVPPLTGPPRSPSLPTAAPPPNAAALQTAPTPRAAEGSAAGASVRTVRFVKGPPPGSRLRAGAVDAWPGLGRAVRAGIAASRDLVATGRRGLRFLDATGPRRSGTGGTMAGPGDGRRRAVLGVALGLSSVAWLALATLAPPRTVESPLVSRVVGHVVEVAVEPAGLPPVSLVVIESPGGSRLSPGSVVGSVPSKVLLDRDGVWRFQTRFGGNQSPIVVLVTPGESTLVVPFPSGPPAAAP